MSSEWLRVNEALRRAKFGRTTLYGLIREGKLKTACLRKRGNIRQLIEEHVETGEPSIAATVKEGQRCK
jgi:hypothetical protein